MYIAVIVLLVIPTVVAFTFMNQIRAMFLHEFIGPGLERDFGFKAGTERVADGKESYEVFVIQWVKPGGILDKAGFRSGDIPVGYKHGFESGFYQDLLWAKDGSVLQIHVLNFGDVRNEQSKSRTVSLSLSQR